MDIKQNANIINNKSNTTLLVDYLEGMVGDEMILNSYIRDMEIVSKDDKTVVIKVNSIAAKEVIDSTFNNIMNQAIENVFDQALIYKLILSGEKPLYEKGEVIGQNVSKKFVFDKYVKADFNKEVIDMSLKVVDKPGKYSPLYIASKSGLGKTHLLHAIGNKALENGFSVAYIEPNKFTRDIQVASQMGGTAVTDFAESYKSFDILLFDDVQNLGDRSVTLKVLFEIINNQIENNKQVVVVSDRVAQELSGFESRFITRFISGISSVIKEPSIKDIEEVLRFKLREEELSPEEWEDEALSFIARNNTSSIRALEGAIKRVAFYTEDLVNTKYTYSVVTNIFHKLSIDPSELTPTRIISVVAKYYKITAKDIVGKSRRKEFVLPRHISIYLVREITNLSYKEIGKVFGGRDHSSIISAVKGVDKSMKLNKAVEMAVRAIEQKVKTQS